MSVLCDIKNSHIAPELKSGNGMLDKSARPAIAGIDQILPRIDEVAGGAASKFGEQLLLFDPAEAEVDAEFADFEIAFGFVERAPSLADIELDFIHGQLQGSSGPFVIDQ